MGKWEIRENEVVIKPRRLNTGDMFRAARVIKRLGVKEELKGILEKITKGREEAADTHDVAVIGAEEKKESVTAIGIDMFFSIIEMLTEENAEKELYKLLAYPLGIGEEQVELLNITTLAEVTMEIADIDEWKDFLSRAVRSK